MVWQMTKAVFWFGVMVLIAGPMVGLTVGESVSAIVALLFCAALVGFAEGQAKAKEKSGGRNPARWPLPAPARSPHSRAAARRRLFDTKAAPGGGVTDT